MFPDGSLEIGQSVDRELRVRREAQSWIPMKSLLRSSLKAVDAKLRRSVKTKRCTCARAGVQRAMRRAA
jgi:hypothetical protein